MTGKLCVHCTLRDRECSARIHNLRTLTRASCRNVFISIAPRLSVVEPRHTAFGVMLLLRAR